MEEYVSIGCLQERKRGTRRLFRDGKREQEVDMVHIGSMKVVEKYSGVSGLKEAYVNTPVTGIVKMVGVAQW